MAIRTDSMTDQRPIARTVLWIGVPIGIGLMGAIDTIVFHQLLQWHNFYIHTTAYWRIFSDGLFHIFTATMLFVGALLLWFQRRRVSPLLTSRPFWAGILLGMGGFQVFDGIVFHKVLQIHPVREGVENILPYDIAWIASGLALFAVGWLLRSGGSSGAAVRQTGAAPERASR